ncbi:hypothetical protein MAPG_11494 [Magnaporthiopsis poae ATCC 64411]|uniref:Heterokaryon incompatibility domain-containing protein n=1 Tax=Magnaporthiopsis poae (strain ATCC 64411 / 73-15) TaxID=644358 RepID=A0A0C4EFF1_MAGP6|nr:hypothetical protein MAPG_11494 [Magnaporthiopsis poae ATCC 64411]
MSRWHEPHCSKPDIHVEGDIPHCHTCGGYPQLDELIAAVNEEGPLPPLPPDEPLDDMNLSWPPSVPYRQGLEGQNSAKTNTLGSGSPSRSDINPAEVEAPAPSDSESPSDPPPMLAAAVYDPPLGADRFRLLCLYAPPDTEGSPIHCDLEVYPLDDCPWYEAISYAWGGEKGENAKKCPVYVGPYWDVILQTQNCWDMLVHTRPRRGSRMIWVDALCINQQDFAERNRQVACMSRIYSQCTSVVVYLGPDVCSPAHLKGRSNPLRGTLRSSILDIWLKRRYFSRVWIIQELVLPRQVVVRIEDTDFFACGPQLEDFAKLGIMKGTWDTSPAPWVQFVAKRSLNAEDMLNVIRLTWKSDASDPRDRIFGILGLLADDKHLQSYYDMHPTTSENLRPDYGLSAQHVFTGFFAHVVAGRGYSQALCGAVGILGAGRMPTWIPDWQAPAGLRPRLFSEVERRIYWRWDVTLTVHQDPQLIPSGRDLSILVALLELFPFALKNQLRARSIVELRTCQDAPDITAAEKDIEDDYLADSYVPWNQEIWVDPQTGALSVKLMHLMPVPSRPEFLQRHYPGSDKTNKMPEYVLAGRNSGVILTSINGLRSLVVPRLDHLFVLLHDDGTYTPLILRPADSESQPSMHSSERNDCLSWGRWQVVTACSRMFIVGDAPFHVPCSVTLDGKYWASATYGVDGQDKVQNSEAYLSAVRRHHGFLPGEPPEVGDRPPTATPRFCITYFQQLRWRLSLALERAVKIIKEAVVECQDAWFRPPSDVPDSSANAAQLLGPKGYTVENVVCLFQAVLDEERSNQRGLVQRELLQKADPRLQLCVDDGTIQLTDWLPDRVPWILRIPRAYERFISWEDQRPQSEFRVLRASMKDVLTALKASRLYHAVRILNKSTHGSALRVLELGPSPTDKLRACPDFPEETIKDLEIDGTTYSVLLT